MQMALSIKHCRQYHHHHGISPPPSSIAEQIVRSSAFSKLPLVIPWPSHDGIAHTRFIASERLRDPDWAVPKRTPPASTLNRLLRPWVHMRHSKFYSLLHLRIVPYGYDMLQAIVQHVA